MIWALFVMILEWTISCVDAIHAIGWIWVLFPVLALGFALPFALALVKVLALAFVLARA